MIRLCTTSLNDDDDDVGEFDVKVMEEKVIDI